MKILVTGGAGFIGSNFIYYMFDKYPDYKITCLDSLTYAGNLNTLKSAFNNENFNFVKGDITDELSVDGLFKRSHFDVVVNFAAESHVDRSIDLPQIFLLTNVIGTQILMSACLKYNVKCFHQISTDEVYGDLPLDKPEIRLTENSAIKTSSPYSASKASADLLVLAYQRTYGLKATISRCSNNYGPYHFPEKLIPLMIVKALNNEKLPVYGNGLNIRDWLYVEDHCSAIDAIIHKSRSGEIYNIGGNTEKTNIEIIKTILDKLNKPHSLITYVADRKGHDLRYAIDSSKIQSELGWKPKIKFEDGIDLTINWYLNNRDWWTEIIDGEYKNYYAKMYKELSI